MFSRYCQYAFLLSFCSLRLVSQEKAEILNRQYFSVFTPENTDEQLPPLNDNFQSMPEIKVAMSIIAC
jgi:hypothetical protein